MSIPFIQDPNYENKPSFEVFAMTINSLNGGVMGGTLTVNNLTVNGTTNGGLENSSLVPDADGVYNIGALPSSRWNNLYLAGDADLSGNINCSGNVAANDADISGNMNLTGNLNMAVGNIFCNNADVSGNLVATNVNSDNLNLSGSSNQISIANTNTLNINMSPLASNLVYQIPDVGSNGSFVVANSTNDITVNQLSYTTLSPAAFKPRSYLYSKNIATALPALPVEQGQSFDNTIFLDPAGDVTNNLGSFTFNNAGQYSVTMSLRALGLNSNLGAALALNGAGERYAENICGSDVNFNGLVTTSAILNVSAADQLFTLAYATASSVGLNVGGAGVDASYCSIVRLA